ncbi:MAG: TlpA family protein disulfide reductase [Candidatus Odinarchaeota archaeon]
MNEREFQDMLDRAVPVEQYLHECSEDCRPKYNARKVEYTLKPDILESIKAFVGQFIVVTISADWCKDCIANVPVLDLVHEATALPVYILGGVKTDPLNTDRQWAVPPSPPEVDTLGIKAIPTILIYTKNGKEIGRIIENPSMKPTLEEELLYFLEKA